MGVSKIKLTIGRLEHISFPELGLNSIEAKIDTGAYTTALHCHDIYLDNENWQTGFMLQTIKFNKRKNC